jgi:hypothetical protein
VQPVPPARPTARPPLPRRRDLRNGRAAPPPPTVSGRTPAQGLALGLERSRFFDTGDLDLPPVPEPSFFGAGAIPPPDVELAADLTSHPSAAPTDDPATAAPTAPGALPRRRDVRRTEQGPRSRREAKARSNARGQSGRSASARSGRSGTTVARSAVLTGLVAVGVVTITGQQLDLTGRTPAVPGTAAELSLAPAPVVTLAPIDTVPLTGEESYWDAGPEVDAAIIGGLRDSAARAAAAKRAAAKRAAEKAAREARAAAKAEALRSAQRNPRGIGRIMAAERGWTGEQWTCLDLLWTKESNWKWYADNPSSSAYGIPQALPGRRMASEGSDWATNPVTQIKWGLNYIDGRYGTPCSAWSHSKATNWY